MAPKSNQEHITDLLERVGKLEHQQEVHKRALEPLVNKFALYWLEENKTPVFALRLNERGNLADLLVITERLAGLDLKTRRERLTGEEDELKQGKWEPYVLPLPVISELIQMEAKQGKDEAVLEPSDANAAMFA